MLNPILGSTPDRTVQEMIVVEVLDAIFGLHVANMERIL